MTRFFTFVTVLWFAGLLTGCQSPKFRPVPGAGPRQELLNNCYSLLYQLLEEQKDVSLLRFIKREPSDVKTLINKIAKTSAAGGKLLEELARQDPAIRLDELRLPPGETATRDAIAATKQKELLGQSGVEFELSLLLTQTEALSYGWHLASVISENEPNPDRAGALAGISKDMETAYQEVYALLLAKINGSKP
jgi:hypothetical protein